MILTDRDFALKLFQISLDSEKTLEIMLRIVLTFTMQNKLHSFVKLNPLIFALSYHTSETISTLSTKILSHIPKKYQISSLALKLFSNDPNTRLKVISQFQLHEAEQIDLASKAQAKLAKKSTKK